MRRVLPLSFAPMLFRDAGMTMMYEPKSARGMFETMIGHVRSCRKKVSSFRDPVKWLIGFECECGEQWAIRLMQFKKCSSDTPLVGLLAFPDQHEAAASAITAGASIGDLVKLQTVGSVTLS